jgi:hypothetical protein
MESVCPLTARDVCNSLEQRIHAVLEKHKDPLASVTTILNRLAQYGEAKPVFLGDGRRAWVWASQAHQLLEQNSTRISVQVSPSDRMTSPGSEL